jgi:hypothetical protein
MSVFDDVFETNYQKFEIRNFQELRTFLDENDCWMLLSTGGFHGTTIKLDEIESIVKDEHQLTEAIGDKYFVTVLVIQPEYAILRYGDIAVGINDIAYLRKYVNRSLKKIKESQEGNT